MGVAGNGAEDRGSMGTQGTPPDLPGLPGRTPLAPLTTTARECTLLVAILPLWIPRRVPLPGDRTQDELLCWGSSCNRLY